MAIKAGDLRSTVTLQRPETHVNDKGRRITEWIDVATVRAARADVSGRESYAALSFHAEDIVTYTIRWRDDVTAEWRILHRGKPWNILEVNHLGDMRDYMRLKCRMVTGEGLS